MSTIKLQNASKILDRLKKAKKFQSDFQLAIFLNKDPSTISTWRRRNSLDYPLLLSLCKDINANYLFYGEEPMYKVEQKRQDQHADEHIIVDLTENERKKLERMVNEVQLKVQILKNALDV